MSEFLHRHQGDWGKPTDLDVFQHCLPRSRFEEIQHMYPDQMQAFLRDNLEIPVQLPTDMGFNQLSWNAVRWPDYQVALMYGISPDQKGADMQQALGTVVAWHDGLHIAGIQKPAETASSRVVGGHYAPYTNLNNDTTYELTRGNMVVSQKELAMNDAELSKAAHATYTYLGAGESIVERHFLSRAPSEFDAQTERPFDTAGLITQGMIDTAWRETGADRSDRPVTFTFFHHGTYIPGFLKMLSRRNRILSHTPHIAPLAGDAHKIVVNGITYELPTNLPVRR